ncbi:MAG: hypothetical protein ACMUJM_01530 [bacterium]
MMKNALILDLACLILFIFGKLILYIPIAIASNPNEGLVAYYPFDGIANDLSGNGNNGTVYGAALTEDRFGDANSAYRFDGIDDYIEMDDALPDMESASVSVWVFIEFFIKNFEKRI